MKSRSQARASQDEEERPRGRSGANRDGADRPGRLERPVGRLSLRKFQEAQDLLCTLRTKIDSFQMQAEEAIFILLPEKIIYIDNVLRTNPAFSPEFPKALMKKYDELLHRYDQAGNPIRINEAFPLTSLPDLATSPLVVRPHPLILEEETRAKRYVEELIRYMTLIRRWVETNRWAAGDMNQLSDESQLSAIARLKATEGALIQVSGLFAAYHLSRGSLVHSFIKHGLRDLYDSLALVDQKLFSSLRDYFSGIRNHMVVLFEGLSVNYERIRDSRESRM